MRKLIFCLLIGALTPGSGAFAQLQPNEVYVHITGRAVVPPCYINNGIDVDINFGAVGVDAARGGKISEERWIPVMCEDAQAAYSIKIWGRGVASNSHVLATEVTGLGISFSEAQNALPLNVFFKPTTANGLMLESHLVITDDFVSGSEGEFSASATLVAQYD